MTKIAAFFASVSLLSACSATTASDDDTGQDTASYSLLSYNNLEWGALNPARGDASPRTGDLWGDRTADVATGMIVQFAEGFASPPHIHNITYRGVVIEGEVHNDDPAAANLWMPVGSAWIQPEGESHITSANAAANSAFIEILSGPYLVQPADEAFASTDKPLNLHFNNLVWDDATDSGGVKTANLWRYPGDEGRKGLLLKIEGGGAASIATSDADFKAVTIKGNLGYQPGNEEAPISIAPGSHFGSSGAASHALNCDETDFCLVFVKSDDSFAVD